METPSASSLQRAARQLWGGLLDLLYPPRCLGCGARTAETPPLCAQCLLRLERAGPEPVRHLLQRLPEAEGLFETAFALWRFDEGGALQRAQHALKYGNRPRYGRALGRLLGAGYREAFPEAKPGLVVPVPLYRARRLERGYNQSAMLARDVAEALGCPFSTGMLVRHRPTQSQTALSRRARWRNVAGAFRVARAQDVQGRTVLLIDDVLTTGATAVAAAQTLHDAGAAAVHLATLALA